MSQKKYLFFNRKTTICIGIILLMICFPMISTSQTSIDPSKLHYNAKLGEKNIYEVLIASDFNPKQDMNVFILKNGTRMFYNLTKGDKFIYTLTRYWPDASGGIFPILSSELELATSNTFVGSTVERHSYTTNTLQTILLPAFENESIAFNFFNHTDNSLYLSNYVMNVSIKGDYVVFSSYQFYNTIDYNATSKYNWKTGWLETTHFTYLFENGTLFSEILLQRQGSISDSSEKILSTSSISYVEIGLIATLLVITIFLAISYKKYKKSEKTLENTSFSSFVKSKVKKINKKKDKQKELKFQNPDKAIKMVEEIIKESAEQ